MKTLHIPLSASMDFIHMTAYLQTRPASTIEPSPLRPAMIVVPGGGYLEENPSESEYVALQFLALGYQVFILSYAVGAPYARFPFPMENLSDAIGHIRENASHFGVAPHCVFACGLSTGGHLVIHAAADPQKNKPDAIILAYPVLDLLTFKNHMHHRDPSSKAFSEMVFTATLGSPEPSDALLESWRATSKVTDEMPPTFIMGLREDPVASVDTIDAYLNQLKVHNIRCQRYINEGKRHGDYLGDWPKIASDWLQFLCQ
jgi:acetyl esterase/lipase